MTLSAILICFQGLFFKNFGLRRFKNEASYTLRMTLSAILICLQGLFQNISPLAVLRRKQVHCCIIIYLWYSVKVQRLGLHIADFLYIYLVFLLV